MLQGRSVSSWLRCTRCATWGQPGEAHFAKASEGGAAPSECAWRLKASFGQTRGPTGSPWGGMPISFTGARCSLVQGSRVSTTPRHGHDV